MVRFTATLHRPRGVDAGWIFLRLPQEASDQLPTRSMCSIEGRFNGTSFATTLEPDGQGGHWMRVKPDLQRESGVQVGDTVEVEMAPAAVEPEPEVPDDIAAALAGNEVAQATWNATTALARRDWVAWIVSGKKAETRTKRIGVALSKLGAGSKRPCCFDRSGMYSKEFCAPEPEN